MHCAESSAQNSLRLLSYQNHRDAIEFRGPTKLLHPEQSHAQHLPTQKKQSVGRLAVRCRGNLLLVRQHDEEEFDFCLLHLARAPEVAAAAACSQHK